MTGDHSGWGAQVSIESRGLIKWLFCRGGRGVGRIGLVELVNDMVDPVGWKRREKAEAEE